MKYHRWETLDWKPYKDIDAWKQSRRCIRCGVFWLSNTRGSNRFYDFKVHLIGQNMKHRPRCGSDGVKRA